MDSQGLGLPMNLGVDGWLPTLVLHQEVQEDVDVMEVSEDEGVPVANAEVAENVGIVFGIPNESVLLITADELQSADDQAQQCVQKVVYLQLQHRIEDEGAPVVVNEEVAEDASTVLESAEPVLPTTPPAEESQSANDEAQACVQKIVYLQLQHGVHMLQEEEECLVPQKPEDLDEDTDSESEEEFDEDDEYCHPKRRGRPRKTEGPKRGRGRPKKDQDDDYVGFESSFDPSSYKRKRKDPIDLCPPPAPKKMRGGRRSTLKKTLKPEVPEEEVQQNCHAFKIKETRIPVDPTQAIPRYHGSNMSHLLRLSHLRQNQERKLENFMLTLGETVNSNAGIENIKQEKREETITLQQALYQEHLSHVARCVKYGTQLTSKVWLKCFAKEVRSEARFANFGPFVTEELPGVNPGVTCDKFGFVLTSAKDNLQIKFTGMLERGMNSRLAILALRKNIGDIRKKKYFIQRAYEKLYKELSTRDSKFDEMSITGVRGVKALLDGPYFKSEDGLMSFHLSQNYVAAAAGLSANAAANNENVAPTFAFPFQVDKQKWTTKDLKALKTAIKESVVGQRTDYINARYLELLGESDKRREAELAGEGRTVESLSQPAQKRKRGRPTREETNQRDKYGKVYPVALRTPILMQYPAVPKQLSEWRTSQERRLRSMGFDSLMRELYANGLIDWGDVALKLMMRTKKLRLASDCQLTYEHEVNPLVNTKRMTLDDTRRLKQLHTAHGNDWDKIAEEINGTAVALASFKEPNTDIIDGPALRTPYQCFVRFRTRVEPPAKPEWDNDMDAVAKQAVEQYPGSWRKIAACLNNDAITKKVIVDRYKKAIIPTLKVGPFSRVEDCLLVLTMQRLRHFLTEEGHFGSLLAFLPWRYETTWRDRAHNLFNDWIVPWTIEEDRLLLDLAVKMNRNWQKISEQFTSFKNRKGCLTRYKILMRNLREDRNATLEEYHEAYSMTRYNIFQYRHLSDILTMLKKVAELNIDLSNYPTPVLSRDAPPSDQCLQYILLVYDSSILKQAVESLEKYTVGRDEFWEKWMERNGERRKTFDRRTFHPTNPQSVASAIHIRGLTLKPKDKIKDLNDFEEEIYTHFGRFSRTKPLKQNTKRPYLPPAAWFVSWSTVERIIATKLKDVEDRDEPCSRKWTRMLQPGQANIVKTKGPKSGEAKTGKRRGRKPGTKNKTKGTKPSKNVKPKPSEGEAKVGKGRGRKLGTKIAKPKGPKKPAPAKVVKPKEQKPVPAKVEKPKGPKTVPVKIAKQGPEPDQANVVNPRETRSRLAKTKPVQETKVKIVQLKGQKPVSSVPKVVNPKKSAPVRAKKVVKSKGSKPVKAKIKFVKPNKEPEPVQAEVVNPKEKDPTPVQPKVAIVVKSKAPKPSRAKAKVVQPYEGPVALAKINPRESKPRQVKVVKSKPVEAKIKIVQPKGQKSKGAAAIKISKPSKAKIVQPVKVPVSKVRTRSSTGGGGKQGK